jgi:hypothetical protein
MIHVICKGCGKWDILGPGHPAVMQHPETGQHIWHDRSKAIRGCECPPETGMIIEPMAAVTMTGG